MTGPVLLVLCPLAAWTKACSTSTFYASFLIGPAAVPHTTYRTGHASMLVTSAVGRRTCTTTSKVPAEVEACGPGRSSPVFFQARWQSGSWVANAGILSELPHTLLRIAQRITDTYFEPIR